MSNVFKTEKIKMTQAEFLNLPDYSVHAPPYPKVGERWKKNVHPKITALDRLNPDVKIEYEWWLAEVIRPNDLVNEHYDIVWAKISIVEMI